jgi:predicted nucleotidyltransferase component of viral defense system
LKLTRLSIFRYCLREKFDVQSEWFNGSADIITYEIDELMATKLRALYQRRKGRDLFDVVCDQARVD